MEYASDGGRAWRERMRLWLQESLNHRVYDPTIESKRIFSAEDFAGLATWKTTDVERFRRVMRVAISRDLDVMANQADYVVCLWDEAAMRGGGTHAELTAATRKGIPVYMVTEIPAEQISGWILACVDRLFANFDELKSLLASTYGREGRQHDLWERR